MNLFLGFRFCLVQSKHIQQALSFSSPPLPVTNSAMQDPHLLINHHPGALGWSKTKEDKRK